MIFVHKEDLEDLQDYFSDLASCQVVDGKSQLTPGLHSWIRRVVDRGCAAQLADPAFQCLADATKHPGGDRRPR